MAYSQMWVLLSEVECHWDNDSLGGSLGIYCVIKTHTGFTMLFRFERICEEELRVLKGQYNRCGKRTDVQQDHAEAEGFDSR